MTEKVQHLLEFFKQKDSYVPQCGIFNSRNIVGDFMTTIYDEPADRVIVDACYNYDYIEVFGLSDDEFAEFCKEMQPIIKENDPFNNQED